MKIKLILIILLLIPISVYGYDIYSNNAILYNLNDNEIIYSKNENEQVMIASLTKIMTAVVTLEQVEDLDNYITVDANAFLGLDGYALAGFKIGDRVTYRDLLYGLMLPSGAECAYALALNISGNISDFVNLMNQKAIELKLSNTHFSNPIGMDDNNNYSTAYDLSLLLKYALSNDEFYKIFTTKEYITTNNIKLESTILEKSSKNNLDSSKILGSKTGFTDGAGYCLASISTINNINYLLITLGANTNNEYQVMDAINTYNYFSSNYGYKKILSYNQELSNINIKNSFKKTYNVHSNIDKYLYLNNEIKEENITYEYEGIEEINNIKKGEYIGKINVKYNDNILYSYNVYLEENVFYINYKFINLILILCLIIAIIIIKTILKN